MWTSDPGNISALDECGRHCPLLLGPDVCIVMSWSVSFIEDSRRTQLPRRCFIPFAPLSWPGSWSYKHGRVTLIVCKHRFPLDRTATKNELH